MKQWLGRVVATTTAGLVVTLSSGVTSVVQAASLWQDKQNYRLQGIVQSTYTRQTFKAGGSWYSYVTARDGDGGFQPIVSQQPDRPVYGYSVDKIAVAIAVMDKVDRGQLKLDQKIELTSDIIAPGSGIYHLQGVYGDQLTIANIISAMLLVSDNTSVRLLGKVAPGAEINQILASKGFANTHVDPLPDNPNRFYLGQTTPREMNAMLLGLANKTVLSAGSCNFLLGILRWVDGYNDGVRRDMSSPERTRVADKYGAFEDSRHEVGVMFDTAGAPQLVYAFFNEGVGDIDNYGSTNPAVEAEAVLGRVMLDALDVKLAREGSN